MLGLFGPAQSFGMNLVAPIKPAERQQAAGATLEQVARVTLPGTDIVRKLVVLRKNATLNAPKKRAENPKKSRSKRVKAEEKAFEKEIEREVEREFENENE